MINYEVTKGEMPKLTRITPIVDGYAVVIVQTEDADGKPGEFLGCFLQTPHSLDDGPSLGLAEAMEAYLRQTSKPKIQNRQQ